MSITVRTVNLSKEYKLGKIIVPALKEMNLEIKTGELVAMVGPSGSGKTTLLNILGLIDTPSAGDFYFMGQKMVFKDFNDMAEIRNQKIGYIFQNFNLIPVLNVYENIEVPYLVRKNVPLKVRHQQIIEVIEKVGLSSHIKHKPDQLSGGQRQRIAIARALAHHPDIILADEPTANLDSHTGRSIIELLVELNHAYKTTIIISSHDPMVLGYVKRVVKVKDGMLEAEK